MKSRSLLAMVAGAACAFSGNAAEFPLSFNADDDSRWYDFFPSFDYFAELSRTTSDDPAENIMYSISAEPDPLAPTVYNATNTTAAVFPQGAAWDDVGSLTYTGSGDGTFPITSVTLDISPFVDLRAASAMGNDYRTEVTNVSGTITFSGGAVTTIDLEADIRFLQRMYNPKGELPFDGTIVIVGDRFDLFVDDTFGSHGGGLHYIWDLRGTVAGVGADDSDVIFQSDFETQ